MVAFMQMSRVQHPNKCQTRWREGGSRVGLGGAECGGDKVGSLRGDRVMAARANDSTLRVMRANKRGFSKTSVCTRKRWRGEGGGGREETGVSGVWGVLSQ